MQLKELYIKDYKILKDFKIKFKKPINILIGINGSGKSTLFEAITIIFSYARSWFIENNSKHTPFDFHITYIIRLEKNKNNTINSSIIEVDYVEVTLEGNEKINDYYRITTNNNLLDLDELINRYGKSCLFPDNLVIYYSGISENIFKIYNDYMDNYKYYLRSTPLSSKEAYTKIKSLYIFYFEKQYFNILLSSLYAFEFNDVVDKSFKKQLNINKVENNPISVVIKKKQFKKNKNHNEFWGADGEVFRFLNILRGKSINNLNYDNKVHEYNFEFDLKNWYEIKELLGGEEKLFNILNVLYASDLLKDIKIKFLKNKTFIDSNDLSEGEIQKSSIVGINELLIKNNTLLLFDEPDTYLHRSWHRKFIKEIIQYSSNMSSISNYLINTHSAEMISSADTINVDVFNMEKGKASNIDFYYGKDINTILYSHFDTEDRDEEFNKIFQNLYNLLNQRKIDEAEKLYNILSLKLNNQDPNLINAKIELDFIKEEFNEVHKKKHRTKKPNRAPKKT